MVDVGALLNGLANNGPWALVAGFLILYLIRSAEKTQALLISVLTEFRAALNGLTSSVDKLTSRIEGIEHGPRDK